MHETDSPLDAARRRHLAPVDLEATYQYSQPVMPTRVVDGDTYEVVRAPTGDGLRLTDVRLLGVDTHEIHGGVSHDSEEYKRGIEEKRYVQEWFRSHLPDGQTVGPSIDIHRIGEWPLELLTHGVRDSFGRLLADVVDVDGTRLSESLFATFDDITYTE